MADQNYDNLLNVPIASIEKTQSQGTQQAQAQTTPSQPQSQNNDNPDLVSRKNFLTFLVKKGVITTTQAEQIKLESLKTGKTPEEIIQEKKILDVKDLYRYKAEFFKVGFIESVFDLSIPNDILIIIKKHIDTVKETLSFPFEYDEETKTLKILLADFLNYNTIQFWRLTFNALNVDIYTAVPAEIEAYINNNFGNVLDTDLLQEVRGVEAEVKQTTPLPKDVELQEEKTMETTSKTAKLVEQIISDAALNRASDIHIEPTAKDIRVRFRIDGVLVERFRGLSRNILPALVARIKIMSHLRIDETRLPQDGRIYKVINGKKFDIRVSTLPTIFGEKVVMRLLERTGHIPTIEETGLRGIGYDRYMEALSLTSGIILITGPTGSGKTTTLAASLSRLNTPKVNIVSVEDPVEIRIDGVTQVQVNPQIGLTFATVLRSILRQDPDIIMVGEIRDVETAHLAIRAALTGHLVLSTLHTNDAPTALPRLIDMGIEPYLVASTVKLVVAQRLVRVICPYTRYKYEPEKPVLETVLKTLSTIPNFDPFKYIEDKAKNKVEAPLESREYALNPPVDPPFTYPDGSKGLYFYKGKPHAKCSKSEYKGRVGIFEVLKVTETIQDMVLAEKTASEIKEQAQKEGMVTLVQDGFLRVLEGVTTVEEVLRVAKA